MALATTFVGEITEVGTLNLIDKDTTVPYPVLNMKVRLTSKNRFGLMITQFQRIVMFRELATMASLFFKAGDFGFFDDCNINVRTFESKRGEEVTGTVIVANVAQVIDREDFERINAALMAEAEALEEKIGQSVLI